MAQAYLWPSLAVAKFDSDAVFSTTCSATSARLTWIGAVNFRSR